jgi:hypothetical protein
LHTFSILVVEASVHFHDSTSPMQKDTYNAKTLLILARRFGG